jgi:hypothetical protein
MRFAVVLALVVACKGDAKSTLATGSGSAPPAGSGSSTGSAVAAGSGSAASGSGSGSAVAPPPPIDSKVMAARCDEPCSLTARICSAWNRRASSSVAMRRLNRMRRSRKQARCAALLARAAGEQARPLHDATDSG